MSQYEVKTADGVVHRIEAITHTNDSLGLTLYGQAGSTVGIFPKIEWMRLVPAVVESSDTASSNAGETNTSGEVAAPAATGE
ncbi:MULTISPECIES: hypothetical protein [Pseudomonas]|uniref:hypothetical protein n=1 Tax=Pseudomonas TaxID=286 RepID=UPI0002A16E34|nr:MULTISPECIES: hypothetical protein [Pseudomonas]AGA72640.1 hypothetical protein B479_08640 [Pseudomonas putida HB3267]MCE0757194.1 hypothetical protein [Pseudomonas asiatica]MCE0946442.1 hypothetical protein [Pseudomonas asiatica]MCE0956005.1 hypothetical protein [Pseudomonas asiatica]MCE1031050.1 hypothetical protein [Pseudomonas asiatica]